MQLLVFILKRVDLMQDLLHELGRNNISGGTVLDAAGIGETLMNMEDLPIFGAMRALLNGDQEDDTKLLLFVVKDDQIQIIRDVITNVIGDLSQPNTGILFSLPISYCEGLHE